MFGLKFGEVLAILLIVVVLFGSTRLPQLGKSMGSAIRNFKRSFAGEDDEPKADGSSQALPPAGSTAQVKEAEKTKQA